MALSCNQELNFIPSLSKSYLELRNSWHTDNTSLQRLTTLPLSDIWALTICNSKNFLMISWKTIFSHHMPWVKQGTLKKWALTLLNLRTIFCKSRKHLKPIYMGLEVSVTVVLPRSSNTLHQCNPQHLHEWLEDNLRRCKWKNVAFLQPIPST